MNDVQQRTRLRRICRALFTVALFFDLVQCALDLASGNQLSAAIMAFAATLAAATVVLQTVAIRRMRAVAPAHAVVAVPEPPRETATGMTTTADLMAGMARLSTALGGCAHPDAEPVDLLLTGERVAWVCPACNAELPAGWTPAKVTGTLTATATMDMSAASALSGSGTLSAKAAAGWCTCPPGACAPVGVRVYNAGFPVTAYCGACGMRIREDEDRARDRRVTLSPVEAEAERHFAQLAKVGRKFCISDCPICGERQWLEEGRFLSAQDDDPAVTSSVMPAGAREGHLDSAGRAWCRDADDLWWIKPTPDSPWFRQNKPEGGEQR